MTHANSTQHRETRADDSPRGDQYLDDRTELAYAYDGTTLIAIAYDDCLVTDWVADSRFDVSLTPAGEARLDRPDNTQK